MAVPAENYPCWNMPMCATPNRMSKHATHDVSLWSDRIIRLRAGDHSCAALFRFRLCLILIVLAAGLKLPRLGNRDDLPADQCQERGFAAKSMQDLVQPEADRTNPPGTLLDQWEEEPWPARMVLPEILPVAWER